MNDTTDNFVRVGTTVLILKGDTVLFGKRTGKHANGLWGAPGGWLEFGESFEENARREVMEETGLKVADIRVATVGNNIFSTEKTHTVSVFLVARWIAGAPRVCEPDKCSEWRWVSWNDLPIPHFPGYDDVISRGFDPFSDARTIIDRL